MTKEKRPAGVEAPTGRVKENQTAEAGDPTNVVAFRKPRVTIRRYNLFALPVFAIPLLMWCSKCGEETKTNAFDRPEQMRDVPGTIVVAAKCGCSRRVLMLTPEHRAEILRNMAEGER